MEWGFLLQFFLQGAAFHAQRDRIAAPLLWFANAISPAGGNERKSWLPQLV